ncbi:DUF3822 family protein [Persicobacter sp. CCB-QB2]|uniref:DUF3822 family protein n=1 Tax=Persicobacter sp. CCB-QB2 TaxID=1561025 RepID=UPI00092EF5D5|nr:DUF3822 family protein [Persicobacter sp. CCB-QB2]
MTAISTLNYQEVHHIQDSEKLVIDDLHHYDLLLQIGQRDVQACIIDSRDSRCLLLDDFILQESETEEDHVEKIRQLIEAHHLLPAGFWKRIKVAFKTNTFALVPSKFFIPDQAQNYLSLVAPVDHQKNLTFSAACMANQEVINVFSASQLLVDFLRNQYPLKELEFYHQGNAVINGIFEGSKDQQDQFHLFVDRFYLHIVYVNNGRLKFYNQFPIKSFDDYGQYAYMVMQEQELNRQDTEVQIHGFISANSAHFEKLKQIFPKLIAGKRPKNLFYPFYFDELAENAYFDILSMSLCK